MTCPFRDIGLEVLNSLMGKLTKTLCLCLCLQSTYGVDHLASYWPLDQNANDLASAGAVTDNGTFVGTESYAPGILGDGISLDGTNYITIPNSPDNDGKSETLSVSVWCKTSGFLPGISRQAIVAQGESNNWRLTRTDDISSNLTWAGGGPVVLNTTTDDYDDGEWHHLVGVAHHGNPVSLYIDGVLIASGGISFVNQTSTQPTMIGSNPNTPSKSWNGEIDDVGIFHAPLDAHQVKAIYDLAMDPNFQYALDSVNELFQIYGDGPGSSGLVKQSLWSHVTADPSDDRTFIQLADDGSGVAGARGPDILSFTPDRIVIPANHPLTLNWSVDLSATSVSIDQGVGDVSGNTTNGVGSILVNPGPATNTTYTLTATNIDGLLTTKQLTVSITDQPIIESFTSTGYGITDGDSITLTWITLNATSATLNGVGVSPNSSLVLTPSSSGFYEFIANNANGSISQSFYVNIVQQGEPLITEFLANNINGLTDEEGDEEDWIQITNPSETDTVIAGNYFLTDDPGNLTKWPLPDGTISPGASILVWASNQDTPPTAYHANFSLKEEGEYLALVKYDGVTHTILSELDDYPKQFADISYGLNGTLDTYSYFATPSPTSNNSGTTYADYVRDTSFSLDRGVYAGTQIVEITTATPGGTIRYTLDNSTPSSTNGLTYSGPITLTKTTTIRATAIKDGLIPSNVDTQTYLFPAWTLLQPKYPNPPNYLYEWPAGQIGEQKTDYRFKPPSSVGVTDEEMITALKAIPSISIVSDHPNLFDSETGIYARPSNRGRDWERPASMELIFPDGYVSPDGHESGFQIDFGLRIRGGASRSGFNFKHAFRGFFRRDYGERALKFPLFGEEGTDEFRRIDLRTSQNYSWAFKEPLNGLPANEDNSTKNTFLREVVVRDTQGAMGQPYTRSRYYHLYLNGLYWGIYMSQERPEAHFGDSYLGGADEDFDTLKSSGDVDTYRTEASDGDNTDWLNAYNLSIAVGADSPTTNTNYFELQGLNSSGVRDVNLPVYLDVDNIISYHLLVFYCGSFDGPLSAFSAEPASNNWFAIRNRNRDDRGWTFFAHDFEHSLGSWPERTEDRTGPYLSPTPANQTSYQRSNPQFMHQHLSGNLEYRTRFGDLVQREFFNDGVFTNSSMLQRIANRRNTVSKVIDAEAARWGDSYTVSEETPLTRTDWTAAADQLETWVVDRNLTVLAQLRADGLYPLLDAPALNQHGGPIANGFNLTLTNPNASGTIYYTTNGIDPRSTGGAPDPSATTGTSLILNSSTHLMARVRVSDSEWSALIDVEFVTGLSPSSSDLVISEINYHPGDPTAAEINAGFTSDEDFEFIEIFNTTPGPIDLTGITIANEISFSFDSLPDPADRVINANERVIIPRKADAFAQRYPGIAFRGDYAGKLSNNTGTIEIRDANSAIIFSVTYRDDSGWSETPDGTGKSLVLRNAEFPNLPSSWRASLADGGNPGTSDGSPFTGYANEDDNQNGIQNLLEAVLLESSGSYFAPLATIEAYDDGEGAQNFLTLTVKHFLPVDNTSIAVEHSSDLATSSWTTNEISVVSSTVTEDGYATTVFRSHQPVSNNTQDFIRVRISLNN